MVDLTPTLAANSDQLISDDLLAGARTVRITSVRGCPDSKQQPIAIHFEGDGGRPYKPCLSMRRVLVTAWGEDGDKYVGRWMTLWRDPAVTFGGIVVGGIRISHLSDIKEPQIVRPLRVNRKSIVSYTVKRLVMDECTVARERARDVARGGTEALRSWWRTAADKRTREHVLPIIEDLRALAETANAGAAKAMDDGQAPAAASVEERLARSGLCQEVLHDRGVMPADTVRAMRAGQLEHLEASDPEVYEALIARIEAEGA